jgi:hypothetical protein
MFSARSILSLAVVLACTAPSAWAAVESPEVLAGVQAYRDLEYDRAIDVLQKAVRQSLTREEKLAAFKTLALCHVAVDKRELAVRDFENVLRIDDSFELDRTSSPRERAALEEAKTRVATGTSDKSGLRDVASLRPEVTPPSPKAGTPVRVRVTYPGGMAEKLSLFYRTRGLGVYNRLVGTGDPTGRFDLTVPGPKVQAPGLEYYMVALDDSGASVAKAGTLSRPLLVPVIEIKKPAYKKGWVWGVVAGVVVVAGAGVATALVLTRPTVSSTAPSTVTIMPY